VKQLLEKNNDPYLAMLAYRSTQLESGYSPSELLMARKLRTTLPMMSEQLKPSLPDATLVRRKERKLKERMKRNLMNTTELRIYNHYTLETQYGFLRENREEL